MKRLLLISIVFVSTLLNAQSFSLVKANKLDIHVKQYLRETNHEFERYLLFSDSTFFQEKISSTTCVSTSGKWKYLNDSIILFESNREFFQEYFTTYTSNTELPVQYECRIFKGKINVEHLYELVPISSCESLVEKYISQIDSFKINNTKKEVNITPLVRGIVYGIEYNEETKLYHIAIQTNEIIIIYLNLNSIMVKKGDWVSQFVVLGRGNIEYQIWEHKKLKFKTEN